MAANVRILRRRIKTAKNIVQVTRAMQMVAASKMRRAQEQTLSGKAYANKLISIVSNLVGRIEVESHPYLVDKKTGKTLVVLFSSDKGLCGSFNTNLFREFLNFTSIAEEFEVLVIGKKLARAVFRIGGLLVAQFPLGTMLPSFESVLPIVNFIVNAYLRGDYKKVVCVYTQFITLGQQKTTTIKLLPIEKGNKQEAANPYIFEPNAQELLSALMPHYLETTIYQILLESYSSEQAARMLAMHAASENAKDIIWELTLFYNKARQERITSELLDISSGVREVVL